MATAARRAVRALSTNNLLSKGLGRAERAVCRDLGLGQFQGAKQEIASYGLQSAFQGMSKTLTKLNMTVMQLQPVAGNVLAPSGLGCLRCRTFCRSQCPDPCV